jgi:Flp pilus assembly pilin Flp
MQDDAAWVEYTVLLGILLIAMIAHGLVVDQRLSCDDRDSLDC